MVTFSASFRLCFLLCTFLISSASATRREVVRAAHGVVATDDGRCSTIGRDVLRDGGHAVDAAVAAALCLGVVSPASSGIGGGAFMLVRSSADGVAHAFDMRETAPSGASQDMFRGNADAKAGGALSVAVPGELAGLHEAWERYGRLPWKRLVRPAAHLASYGFQISPYLHMQMLATEAGIMADEGLRSIFTSNGSLLQPGDICFNKRLGTTLRHIARYGPKAFYNGTIGVNLVKDIRKAGGILTMEDLQNYRVKIRKPISANVMGVQIVSMPPPSSGGAAMVLILHILAQYGFPVNTSSPLVVHRQIEALKYAFAARMKLGDPDYTNVEDVISDMLDTTYAEKLKKAINDSRTFDPDHYGYRGKQVFDHGTSHMSIVDGERNAVSMTTTVNGYFGAKLLSPSTGILLNNEMDDFSIPANVSANVPPPAPANFIIPGKRPLSSMTPTIVLKGDELKAVIGASGGAYIIGGTTEVLLNHLGKGMDPLSSVLAPRFYHELIPNVVQYENWTVVTGDHFEIPKETRESLQKKGHALQPLPGGTICQFVIQDLDSIESRKLVAVSDPRKGGYPAGY